MGLRDGLHGSCPAERHCIRESAIVLKVYGILIMELLVVVVALRLASDGPPRGHLSWQTVTWSDCSPSARIPYRCRDTVHTNKIGSPVSVSVCVCPQSSNPQSDCFLIKRSGFVLECSSRSAWRLSNKHVFHVPLNGGQGASVSHREMGLLLSRPPPGQAKPSYV
jgi:hypothetical protein